MRLLTRHDTDFQPRLMSLATSRCMAVREASPRLTARRLADDDPAHEQLAQQLDDER